jgi:GST-like protein
MYDLYTWGTPNGRKISIMLEELGVPYTVHAVNIARGEQFTPEFTSLSPNQKIPALFDRESNLGIFESGAILMYLADKHGRFFPSAGEARLRTIEWLMWQLGRAHYFLRNNPGKAPFADAWFAMEAQRLYGVLNGRLDGRDYIVEDYSIADIACFPWIARHEWHRQEPHTDSGVDPCAIPASSPWP